MYSGIELSHILSDISPRTAVSNFNVSESEKHKIWFEITTRKSALHLLLIVIVLLKVHLGHQDYVCVWKEDNDPGFKDLFEAIKWCTY